MSVNTDTLAQVAKGIGDHASGMKSIPRVRVGTAIFARVYAGLCESEYEYTDADGRTVLMWMRWTRAKLNTPHYLVCGTPVELDPTLDPEAIVYDGPESM